MTPEDFYFKSYYPSYAATYAEDDEPREIDPFEIADMEYEQRCEEQLEDEQ